MNEVQRGVLFVPDITGFTKFVKETDFELGKHVTQQLLSTIIKSNTMGLKISEIEGDAVLFYKLGAPPSVAEISRQFEKMRTNFYNKLEMLSLALNKEFDLSLKLIVHYGEIAEYSINGFNKLYGPPVIEVHKLLKNSVEDEQYILMTNEYLNESKDAIPVWGIESQKCEIYENIGLLCYSYLTCEERFSVSLN